MDNHAVRSIAVVTAFNSGLLCLIYHCTSQPNPGLLVSQLLVPLILWEFLLLIAILPEELINRILDDLEQGILDAMPSPRRRYRFRIRADGDFYQRATTSASATETLMSDDNRTDAIQ